MRPSPAASAPPPPPFIPAPARARQSVLHLPGGLVDVHCDHERLAAAPVAAAAHRRRAEIIEADRDADMRVGRADAVRRIEADPAELRHEGFGPGVSRLLLRNPVGTAEI